MRLLEDHFDRCIGSSEWRTRNVMHLVPHVGATSHAVPSLWHPTSRVIKWNLLRAWQTSDARFLESLEKKLAASSENNP